MQKTSGSSFIKVYALISALLGWFAVIAQFVLLLGISKGSVADTVIRFFSFFTILTNILVAFTFSFVFFEGGDKWSRFFSKASTLTAITVYIIVVGAVYNIILRMIWHPVGLQKLVDELLHSVIPLLTLLFWIFFVKKGGLVWNNAFSWLLYPMVYSIFIAIRGAFTGYYPYPFINVPEIGYSRALLNGGFVVLVFIGLSLFLIAVGKFISRRSSTAQ